MKERVDSIRKAIFNPAKKNPKLRIVFLIINIIFVLFALILIIVGASASLGTKAFSYLPPILAAVGFLLLVIIPLGLYGVYYASAEPHRRFIAIQLYLFLIILLSLALILLGGFFIVFYPSLKAKVTMRWDVFVDVVNPDHECGENEKKVDKFCSFLMTGGVFSMIGGIILLSAPIITLFLIGWKLYLNSLYMMGSALIICTGLFTIGVGVYLLISYSRPQQARFTIPSTAPAIYMMIGCGVLPIGVGILGIVLGFQKKIPRSAMFLFEVGLVLVIILVFATAGYFISIYTKTSLVQIDNYIKVNQAWVAQAITLHKCFLSNESCALNTCNAEISDEESPALLEWLRGCFTARVNSDFFLCGFSGVGVAIFALLMAVSFAIELLIYFIKNFGKEEVEDEEEDEEEQELYCEENEEDHDENGDENNEGNLDAHPEGRHYEELEQSDD